jgi:hypothetical protein
LAVSMTEPPPRQDNMSASRKFFVFFSN